MQTQTDGWHVARWGTWGWIETVLKLVGIAAGVVAFFQTTGTSDLVIGGHPHLAAVIVLAVLTLAAFGQLAFRFRQQEVISLIFAVLNLLGTLGLLIALLKAPESLTLPLIYGGGYVLGQLAKLVFLRISGYTEGGADTRGMLMVTGGLTVVYVVFMLLLVV